VKRAADRRKETNMAQNKPVCSSCEEIVVENGKTLDGKFKCNDCYVGKIKIPGQTLQPPHANLTPRQRTKLN